MLKSYDIDGGFYLADDTEESFLWELDALRQSLATMDARAGTPSQAETDTRKKVAFLESFVESDTDAAKESVRVKPDYRGLVGQISAEAQHLYRHAHMPIFGARLG